LAEQAQILVAEAEENNWDDDRFVPRWRRWDACSLCEQDYYGVVRCALGWACWKTYLGRPEANEIRRCAMNLLGNGLTGAEQHEAALTVKEAELSMQRRLGDSEDNILAVQSNLATSYQRLGRHEEAMCVRKDVYSGHLKLNGKGHESTLLAANNYASSLAAMQRYAEAKWLLRRTLPAARRAHGDSHETTLRMRGYYAEALYKDDGATLDDLREAVTTLEDTERTARRVFGGAHPITKALRNARAALRAREEAAPDDVSSVCEEMAAMTPPGDS